MYLLCLKYSAKFSVHKLSHYVVYIVLVGEIEHWVNLVLMQLPCGEHQTSVGGQGPGSFCEISFRGPLSWTAVATVQSCHTFVQSPCNLTRQKSTIWLRKETVVLAIYGFLAVNVPSDEVLSSTAKCTGWVYSGEYWAVSAYTQAGFWLSL